MLEVKYSAHAQSTQKSANVSTMPAGTCRPQGVGPRAPPRWAKCTDHSPRRMYESLGAVRITTRDKQESSSIEQKSVTHGQKSDLTEQESDTPHYKPGFRGLQ